ncbi:MAG: hypothetical protein ACLGI5_16620 [Thermoleophilia bacterium]
MNLPGWLIVPLTLLLGLLGWMLAIGALLGLALLVGAAAQAWF